MGEFTSAGSYRLSTLVKLNSPHIDAEHLPHIWAQYNYKIYIRENTNCIFSMWAGGRAEHIWWTLCMISGYSERTDGRGDRNTTIKEETRRLVEAHWADAETAETQTQVQPIKTRRHLPNTLCYSVSLLSVLSVLCTCITPAAAQRGETPRRCPSGSAHTSHTPVISSYSSTSHGKRVLHHNSVSNAVLLSCCIVFQIFRSNFSELFFL